jgi:cell division septal protein FtsQ
MINSQSIDLNRITAKAGMMKYLYLTLSIIGIIVPYYFGFLIFQSTGTFDLVDFVVEGTSNNSAAFLASDLTITAITALIYICYEGLRSKIKYWWVSVLGIFLVGVSFGFPFFLFLREVAKNKTQQ